jgi:hypothetical protein
MAGKRPKGSPERIGRLLTGDVFSKSLVARLHDLKIWECWDQAVGSAIAARARPLRLMGGVLTITVTGGPWMQQLSFMKNELCERINSLLGEERVKEIVLRAGRLHQDHQPAEAPRSPPKPLSSLQQEQISQQVSAVEDAELRRSLQLLMEVHYSRK